MARSKVKARSHHDIANLHTPTNVPINRLLFQEDQIIEVLLYQLHTPYGSEIQPGQDFQTHGHYSKVKGKSRPHHDTAHLHPLSRVL